MNETAVLCARRGLLPPALLKLKSMLMLSPRDQCYPNGQ
jgi:hypothetical protein